MNDYYILDVKKKIIIFLGKGNDISKIKYFYPEISVDGEIVRLSSDIFESVIARFKSSCGEGNWIISDTEDIFERFIGESDYIEIGGNRDMDIGIKDYMLKNQLSFK